MRSPRSTLGVVLIAGALLGYLAAEGVRSPVQPAAAADPPADAAKKPAAALSASDALGLLMRGNERYVSGRARAKDYVEERSRLTKGQQPYAIVLCCSDSRVPPEIVFDESLGKLFVARVAGNVTDPVVLGSIEYAAEHLHSPLLLVLGHDSCGAVQASLGGGHHSANLDAVLKAIVPAAAEAKRQGLDEAHMLDAAVRGNVLLQVRRLTADSAVLAGLVEKKELQVAGAVYHLDTGKVEVIRNLKRSPP